MADTHTPARTPARTPTTTTPRRALSAEPNTGPPSSRAAPGSEAQQPPRSIGSAHRRATTGATPHGRAALRTLDSRRAAAILTPRQRQHLLRRRQSGLGGGGGGGGGGPPERETAQRQVLLDLGRLLAGTGTTKRRTLGSSSSSWSSSSSPAVAGEASARSELRRSTRRRGGPVVIPEDADGDGDWMDDDDDSLPIDRPRLSLPIDEDNDDDLKPHRSAGLEDENFTLQSIELPRRDATAAHERRLSRFSVGSARMSDYYFENAGGFADDDDDGEDNGGEVGIDSGFFPPTRVLDEEVTEMPPADVMLESEADRGDTGRGSDFGIDITAEGNETTFMIGAQAQSSPTRPLDAPQEMDVEPLPENDDRWASDSDPGGGEMLDFGADMLEPGSDSKAAATVAALHGKRKKRGVKLSKYGVPYPSLPPAVVRRLAQTFAKMGGAKGKITPDALQAIMQASDWFFEQLGDDLQAYANHAGRKTIDESDMLTLMKR